MADFSVWKTACRFSGKLAEADECKECQDHFKRHGHFPKEVRCYQVPGAAPDRGEILQRMWKAALANPVQIIIAVIWRSLEEYYR